MGNGPRRELNIFDSTCLIVGIIVGAGIYQVAPTVAAGAGSAAATIGIWVAGGALSLFGALSYAELASALPREGGDYVYLTRAYGPRAGFLFGWIQTTIVRPGDIAIMAFAFATYARSAVPATESLPLADQLLAAGAIAILTALNAIGVREGKWTQNLLTSVKVLGLLVLVGAAFLGPAGSAPPAREVEALPVSVALILVLFTYGGWNEMAYVAAEVRDPSRNLVRALVIGTLAVVGLYVLANLAFLRALGIEGLMRSSAVAADAVAGSIPRSGPMLISLLICISALGAVNGLIFAGSRISYAVGSDHRLFRPLGHWHPRTGTPLRALVLQAFIAILLVFVLGSFIDTVIFTAAAVYAFYLATGAAVLVLRRREPELRRPYRVLGYPVTTLIFCGTSAFLIYSAVMHKPLVAAACCALILLGLPAYALSSRSRGG